MSIMKKDVKDAKGWSDAPNGCQTDQGEYDRPEQCQRYSYYGCDYAIQPETGEVEQQVSQTPDKLNTMSWIRFSDHVFEQNIDGFVHSLLIPVQHIESNSEVLSA